MMVSDKGAKSDTVINHMHVRSYGINSTCHDQSSWPSVKY